MEFTEHFIRAADGTILYARDYPAASSSLTPVICLPGLTRNARDFEPILPWLARSRRVVALDFRGRGKSAWADPATYHPGQESADTLAVMDHLGIPQFAIIGTSRGGIVAMVMASQALPRIAGVAFNDIGPKIEAEGLLRIRSYLGSDRTFATWQDAAAAVQASNPGFPDLDATAWMAFARRLFSESGAGLKADYDPALSRGFPSEPDIRAGNIAETWPLLDLFAALPCLVLRGEHSDLLSEATVDRMQQRLAELSAVTVPRRGHVPFLDEPESLSALGHWLARLDARPRPPMPQAG